MGSSKDGQGPLNFQVLASPVLKFPLSVFHFSYTLFNINTDNAVCFGLSSEENGHWSSIPYNTSSTQVLPFLSHKAVMLHATTVLFYFILKCKILDSTSMIEGNMKKHCSVVFQCKTVYLPFLLIFNFFDFFLCIASNDNHHMKNIFNICCW